MVFLRDQKQKDISKKLSLNNIKQYDKTRVFMNDLRMHDWISAHQ